LQKANFYQVYVYSEEIEPAMSYRLSPLYTVLALAPEWYLSDPKDSVPRLRSLISHRTHAEAELFLIADGMSEVAGKWDSLDGYVAKSLAEDFMNPQKYNMLLFDDENFTRSRKYFWLIGCLGEFIICIADNVKQWDLYKEARIQPLLDMPNLDVLLDAACLQREPFISDEEDAKFRAQGLRIFKELVNNAQQQRDRLKDLQTQFENKLERVKTLRDGVSLFQIIIKMQHRNHLLMLVAL
jgi:hypothetical protein